MHSCYKERRNKYTISYKPINLQKDEAMQSHLGKLSFQPFNLMASLETHMQIGNQ